MRSAPTRWHHTSLPLSGALLISIVGHLLLMNGWRAPTPSPPAAVEPIHVRLEPRSGGRQLSPPPARPLSTPAAPEHITPEPAPQAAPASRVDRPFLPPSGLDQPALPKSGPEIEALDDIPTTGMIIRLRLYIDETGVVRRVDPLTFAPDDETAVRQLQQVFLATTFLAGQHQGQYVRSYLDIEITPNPLR